MNQHLQTILDFIQQDENLTAEQKTAISKSLKDADKELEITAFKLDRTEKVKRTTAILLEETIEELEQKRKAVEAQNRELEIESSLERVRTMAMSMSKPNDLMDICQVVYAELQLLGFNELRNAMINIYSDDKNSFLNYDYSASAGKTVTAIPYNFHPLVEKQVNTTKNANDAFYEMSFAGKDLKDFRELRKNNGELDDPKLDEIASLHYYYYSIGTGSIGISTYNAITENKLEQLKRFRNVFNLSYQRYADITKAEAQAREAQIELALERVRARTMAMQKSAELPEAANNLFLQVQALGIPAWSAGYCIWDEDKQGITFWMSSEGVMQPPAHAPLTEDPSFIHMREAYEKGDTFHVEEVGGEALVKHYQYMRTLPVVGEILDSIIAAGHPLPTFQIFHCVYFSQGFLLFITYETVPNAYDIFKRFGKVFEQTYTRFLDLQKAEAQAKEATIEAALERVRAKTMAMHSSEDVVSATSVLLIELGKLGIKTLRCGILIIEENETFEVWSVTNTAEGKTIRSINTFDINDHPLWQAMYKGWKQKDEFFYYHLAGEEKKTYYSILSNKPNYLSLPINELPDQNFQGYNFPEGTIWTFSLQPHSHEDKQVMKRFTAVFSLTFRRYRDLQKAEAQAREAQVEAALERVRSKTMTMHNSRDVGDTVATMFDELVKLGIEKTIRCGIIIIDDTKQMEVWNASDNGEGEINLVIGGLDMTIHPALLRVYDAWKNKLPEISYEFIGEDLKDYFRAINNSPEYPFQMDIASLPARSFLSDFFFGEGAIFAFTHDAIAIETTQIFKRFAAVFGQTYRRYLDLLKAEAQAREGQIEVSLERVRAQTMAMNKSQDLQEVVSVIFRELDKLDLKAIRCSIGIINGQNRSVNVWTTTTTKEGTEVNFSGNESMDIHPMLQGAFAGWQKQQDFYYVLEGEDLTGYYDTQKGDNYKLPDAAAGVIVSEKDRQYYFCTYFPAGGIYFFRLDPFAEELVKLIRRFASAFSLAYKRFEDLKQSEARALEVIKESSLDRVRAETASMRTTADLDRITPLIWNELTTLGVPFIRCGVFIIDDAQQQVHTFLSAPDGKAIAAFHLPYDTSEQITQIVVNWRQNKIYKDHWDEAAFDEWTNTLLQKGIIASQEQYLTASHPANLHLHFLPFRQGMLYVGSETTFADEEIQLVQSLADAFSTAYARYEDFNKLELAKEQIEKALVDLKQTQTLLVQSEKMASLGQLTAGIAHEIQNPLNFVNNFSEVNTELIEEMKEQLAIGKMQDAIEIANDIKENEQKINHHGKRADAIVKGMLQHSRTSTAIKEPTNINALADEYLRLAYHGLRAKDKSFNATLKTDFDENIGNINIIPQDIGRVILNLITNAFYTTNEKQKQNVVGYEPTVTVSTKRDNDRIQVSVKDNGNGIPQKIVDKIFQPFFTTKPTGQGTGLGLSLAYDIVKAHGGELKVETKENEGSKFIIQLPR
jgi:signal transduction histidine kinase